MKYDLYAIRVWSEAGNCTGPKTVLEMCDELDRLRKGTEDDARMYLQVRKERDQLRSKLDLAVEALSCPLSKYQEEALTKIRGER